MTDPKTHYSCAELAKTGCDDVPTTERGALKLVTRECWSFIEQAVKGGKNGKVRLYAPPPAALREIRKIETMRQRAAQAEQAIAIRQRLRAEFQQERAQKIEKAQTQLAAVSGLTKEAAATIEMRTEIVEQWELFVIKTGKKRNRKSSYKAFSEMYSGGGGKVAQAVREAYPTVSARTLERWVLAHERTDLSALADKRHRRIERESLFDATPALAAAIQQLLIDRPGIAATHLEALLKTASIDQDTGEELFRAPSYHQVYRYMKRWISRNEELYTAATNPDEWKNKYMVAFGDAAADVEALNQRWEMDATPADFMLRDDDGRKRRYSASVIVDVYSRRILVVLSRTSKAQTHCLALRAAILLWGVPQEIVTDNGKDYQAKHFRRVLEMFHIAHHTTAPFSPWEKPHVERGIGSVNHCIIEGYSNFIGHDVGERQAIEARQSFAERLFEKDAVVELEMSAEQLQAHINLWLAGTYEQREHSGIGMSPFARVAAWTGPVQRIEDERALDVLLAPPAGGGTRIVQKKGVLIDNAWFIHLAMAAHVGKTVQVHQTEDLGQVVVYLEDKFLCVARSAKRMGVAQQDIAITARKLQREQIAAARKAIKKASRGKFTTDELVTRTLNEKAAAAGKLALLPKPSVPYTTPALQEAAKAADALAGKIAPQTMQSDAQHYLEVKAAQAAKAAGEPLPTPQPRSEIPETPELRFRLWTELSERFVGGDAPEIELSPRLRTWLLTYPKSPEFSGLNKRYQQQKETGNPPASSLPVDISTHRKHHDTGTNS